MYRLILIMLLSAVIPTLAQTEQPTKSEQSKKTTAAG
jgi:hypothetical protein